MLLFYTNKEFSNHLLILDTTTKDNTPLPFVFKNLSIEPSDDGIVNVVPPDVNFKFEPSDGTIHLNRGIVVECSTRIY